MSTKKDKMHWRCNTPELLKETLENIDPKAQHGVLQKPFQILMGLLAELSDKAILLDNPEINCMMIKLGLYEGSLPHHPEYEAVNEYLEEHYTPGEKKEVTS